MILYTYIYIYIFPIQIVAEFATSDWFIDCFSNFWNNCVSYYFRQYSLIIVYVWRYFDFISSKINFVQVKIHSNKYSSTLISIENILAAFSENEQKNEAIHNFFSSINQFNNIRFIQVFSYYETIRNIKGMYSLESQLQRILLIASSGTVFFKIFWNYFKWVSVK